MLRKIVLSATLGLAAVASAAPAGAAVTLYCVSVGNQCSSWSCPAGTDTVIHTGPHTGPWIVVCAPNI